MTYTITGYKNTGFDTLNRPSAPSVLATATTVTFPSNFLWQNKGLATVRIAATFEEVCDIDYVKIGDTYYVVNGITMLNEKTAELSLLLDSICTAGGIGSITVQSGWTKRAHASHDGLFENNIPESWTPSQEMYMDKPVQIGPTGKVTGDESKDVPVVLTTVDLEQTSNVAETYIDAAGADSGSVTVPKVPGKSHWTSFVMPTGDGDKHYYYPGAALFRTRFVDDYKVWDGITKARSLGIDNCIIKSYVIPEDMAGLVALKGTDSSAVVTITGIRKTYNSPYNFKYTVPNYTIKNNKVFSLYNAFTLYGISSGNTRAFDAHEISHGNETVPTFIVYSDPGPDGCPYIQPAYYDGSATIPFQNSVPGSSWLNQPISYNTQSGNLVDAMRIVRQNALEKFKQANEVAKAGIDAAGSLLGLNKSGKQIKKDLTDRRVGGAGFMGLAGEAIGAVEGYVETQYNRQTRMLDFSTAQNIRAPEVEFPCDPSIQGYIGNGFYISRTRLCDNDVKRLDAYLTQFGYAQDKPFEKSDMNNRQYFNYIQTTGANVLCNQPLRIRNDINDTLDAGVRLWHVLPNASAMSNNPIRSGS